MSNTLLNNTPDNNEIEDFQIKINSKFKDEYEEIIHSACELAWSKSIIKATPKEMSGIIERSLDMLDNNVKTYSKKKTPYILDKEYILLDNFTDLGDKIRLNSSVHKNFELKKKDLDIMINAFLDADLFTAAFYVATGFINLKKERM